jgi:hypothetical protein
VQGRVVSTSEALVAQNRFAHRRGLIETHTVEAEILERGDFARGCFRERVSSCVFRILTPRARGFNFFLEIFRKEPELMPMRIAALRSRALSTTPSRGACHRYCPD